MTPVVARVSAALRKLADAAGGQQGFDCHVHAVLGREALREFGVGCSTVVGLAAWRVGPGDGDAVSHVFNVPSHLPAGAKGMPYHSWLQAGDILIDFTTYQLKQKAAMLDQADGGATTVEWCPDFLLVPTSAKSTYEQVMRAPGAGVFFYAPNVELQHEVEGSYEHDPSDLEMLRVILANPDAKVMGPNNLARAR